VVSFLGYFLPELLRSDRQSELNVMDTELILDPCLDALMLINVVESLSNSVIV
jgi:hypothetical protein